MYCHFLFDSYTWISSREESLQLMSQRGHIRRTNSESSARGTNLFVEFRAAI